MWLAGVFLALAITAGPMFAPAYASFVGTQDQILIWREAPGPKVTIDNGFSALRCRSHEDGRQKKLLELASTRLGGGGVEHVSARFWNEASGTADVTFEFWHGGDSAQRKLYLGHGVVDLETCEVDLVSLS